MKKQYVIPLLSLLSASASAVTLKVTVTNNSPADGGVALAPVWLGFHNGSFDSYNGGLAITTELETLAELGDVGPLSNTFGNNGSLVPFTTILPVGTRAQGQTGILAPGQMSMLTFEVAGDGSNNFLSYASMILPSSDFFVANGNPLAHSLADLLANGNVVEFNIGLPGSIIDAGTEVNDFNTSAGNAFGPSLPMVDPTTGAIEGGVATDVDVSLDPFANYLNQPDGFQSRELNFNNAGFYPNGVGSIRLEVVPEPSTVLYGALFGLGLITRRRRRVA